VRVISGFEFACEKFDSGSWVWKGMGIFFTSSSSHVESHGKISWNEFLNSGCSHCGFVES
jgi:hypothetical protein